jgi:2,3-dihydroxy-2,3-dihydro-p-cumate dehydrogenase
MSMAQPLAGQIAIVTGAGGGIGRAIAERLLCDGAKIMVCDLDPALASAAADALAGPDYAASFAGNLADEADARRLVDDTLAKFGRIDILVNNAGGGILRPFLDHTPDTLRATIDRNLWTAIWCSWLVLPHMQAAGFGRIINIGADSVRNGLFDHAAYNAAKGGVHGMTTGLAREFALDGITVNTVAPCAVQTRQLEDVRAANPALVEKVLRVIPMGRAASEAEVASMVAYLATHEAAFVTGQVISVNGGSTML